MKKLLGLVLSIFILVPTLASAKMIKFGEGEESIYINEIAIHIIAPIKKGCEITYLQGGATRKWVMESSCSNFVKEAGIEISNKK